MADNLIKAIISADGSSFTKTISQLESQYRRFQDGLKNATSVEGIGRINRALDETKKRIDALKSFQGFSPLAVNSFGKLTQSANSANLALINTGRVVQDLPFGFLGIANNLNPLLESFQRLKQQAGSSSGALAALGQSLKGAGGLGFALSLASSAMLIFSNGFSLFSRKTGQAKQDADAMKESIKNLSQSTAQDLSKLTVLVGVIENVNTSNANREKALKAINEQYGKYLPNLEKEGITAANVAKNYGLIADALLRQAVVKGLQKQVEDQVAKTAEQIIKYRQAEEKRKIATEKANEATKAAPTPLEDAAKALDRYNRTSKDGLIALSSQQAELRKTATDAGDYDAAIKRLTQSLIQQLAPLLKISTEFADLGINLKTDKVDTTIDKIIAQGKRLAAEFGNLSEIHLDVLPTFSATDTKAEQLAKAKQIITDVSNFFNDFSNKERALKLAVPITPDPIISPFESSTVERTKEEIENVIKSLRLDPVELEAPFDFSIQGAQRLEAFKKSLKEGLASAFNIKLTPEGLSDTEKKLLKIHNETIFTAQAITGILTPAFQNLFSAITQGENPIKAFFKGIGQAVQQLITKLIAAAVQAAVLSAITGGASGGLGGFGKIFKGLLGFADGGFVSGPGTSKSDSIPAMLSNGEYVMNAAAVNKYGLGLLNGLNARRYADGGLVSSGIRASSPSLGRISGGMKIEVSGTLVGHGQSLVATISQVTRSNTRNF